jgi:hypothetical protein
MNGAKIVTKSGRYLRRDGEEVTLSRDDEYPDFPFRDLDQGWFYQTSGKVCESGDVAKEDVVTYLGEADVD